MSSALLLASAALGGVGGFASKPRYAFRGGLRGAVRHAAQEATRRVERNFGWASRAYLGACLLVTIRIVGDPLITVSGDR